MLKKKACFFFAITKMNITSLNAIDIHDIYYRERIFLIKQTSELSGLVSDSKTLLISADQLVRGVEIAVPGVQYTIFYTIDDSSDSLPKIIALDFSIPTEETLAECFHTLPLDSYKSVENLTVCTLAKALRGELTAGGIIHPITEFNIKAPGTGELGVMELVKLDGQKLAGMIVNEQSYDILSRIFNIDVKEFEEGIEGQSRWTLRSHKSIEEHYILSIEDMLEDNSKPAVVECYKVNHNEKLKVKDRPGLTSSKDVEKQHIADVREFEDSSVKLIVYEDCSVKSEEILEDVGISNTQILKLHNSAQQIFTTSVEETKENKKLSMVEDLKNKKEGGKDCLESNLKTPLKINSLEAYSFRDDTFQDKSKNVSEIDYKMLILDKIEKVSKRALSKLLNTDNLGVEPHKDNEEDR